MSGRVPGFSRSLALALRETLKRIESFWDEVSLEKGRIAAAAF
jgi:hypothetical protein